MTELYRTLNQRRLILRCESRFHHIKNSELQTRTRAKPIRVKPPTTDAKHAPTSGVSNFNQALGTLDGIVLHWSDEPKAVKVSRSCGYVKCKITSESIAELRHKGQTKKKYRNGNSKLLNEVAQAEVYNRSNRTHGFNQIQGK